MTLGLSANARIEAAQGFCGGLNAGVWFVRGGGADSDELVLKLVEFDSSRPANLVEADALIRLHRERPAIANDPSVSFPLKVVRILGVGGVRRFDLMVMRRAPGQDLATAVGDKWRSGQRTLVMAMMYMVGSELRELHRRYPGLQHGDCQPSNVFFDEMSRRVTFIDIGGMACRTFGSDLEHFTGALSKMAPYYGADFLDCATHFTNGYNGASH